MSIIPKKNIANQLISEDSFDNGTESKVLALITERLKKTIGIEICSKNCDLFCKTLEAVCIEKCLLKSHNLECDISELYKIIERLTQIINLFQNQRFLKAKIKFSDMRINLKINRNNEPMCSKTDVQRCISDPDMHGNAFLRQNRVLALENQVKDLEFKLELGIGNNYFIESYPELPEVWHYNETIEIKDFPNSNECYSINKFVAYQNKILLEKEWDAFDSKILKAKYQKKLKKISAKKLKLHEQETYLRKENLELEKEKSALDKMKKSFDALQSKNQSKIQILRQFLSGIPSNLIQNTLKEDSIDMSTIDTEISQLKQELKGLEMQYKSKSILNKQNIEAQMEHIKNQLLTYRSMKALQDSKHNNSKLQLPSSNILEKSFSPKNLNRKFDYSKIEDLSHIKSEETDNQLRRQLRVKDLRIREKEEEVYIHEQRALNFWLNNLETKEVISNTQKALAELKRAREKYESRLEFFEKKKLELQNKLDEIFRRESEMQEMKDLFEKEKEDFEIDKCKFIERIHNLIKLLE